MRHLVHILMCLPIFLAAGLLWLAGAGTAAVVLALGCAAMTLVMAMMAGREAR